MRRRRKIQDFAIHIALVAVLLTRGDSDPTGVANDPTGVANNPTGVANNPTSQPVAGDPSGLTTEVSQIAIRDVGADHHTRRGRLGNPAFEISAKQFADRN